MSRIEVGIVNSGSEVSNEEVASYLSAKLPGSTFEAIPYRPGTKAGFDIVGVLATVSTLADLAALSEALIAAYRTYIWPLRANNPSAAIVVRVYGPDGKSSELTIGGATTDEVVVENLRATFSTITADTIRIKR